MIPVYKPYLPSTTLRYAHDVLDSTWVSHGKYIQIVQERLQDFLQAKYVLPLNNGTSACHIMAKIARAKCNNWNIIVPNNVYVAAWNAFLFDKDWKLTPVETDLNTWNYDTSQLDTTIKSENGSIVLIVHNIGNIINVPALQRKYPNCIFLEDNCEGFLGTYEGQFTGTASTGAAISFFGNKNITCGEGGAFVTNNEDDYNLARCFHGQGQSSQRFIHDQLGYNYRMTNVQAAILCGQLDVVQDIREMKAGVFDIYRRAFRDRTDVAMRSIDPNTTHANWMFGIRVLGNPNYKQAEEYFKWQGIEIRPMFYSITSHKHLQNHPDISRVDCTNANLLNQECIILPSYPTLNIGEQNHIIHTVNQYVKGLV